MAVNNMINFTEWFSALANPFRVSSTDNQKRMGHQAMQELRATILDEPQDGI
jgi:hypothetical protein